MKRPLRLDEIGYWSEVKLDIIRDYATAYSKILTAQQHPKLEHIYIDAFAGAGIHISKTSGEFVPGSPQNALLVRPPFREYHFIDLDELKIESLERLSGDRPDVHIYHGDCNKIMLEEVLPRAQFKNYRRALCILDPYGLHLRWDVIATAGQMKTVDIFLNFPIMDMNMNVLWHKAGKVSDDQAERMNRFWGDDTWKDAAYIDSPQPSLFGEEEKIKARNRQIAQAYRKRLIEVAGFAKVPEPMPMRNSTNSVIYYLFFASQKPVAEHIVKDIFKKYEKWQGA
jgi:three-Cys-motif partner protein